MRAIISDIHGNLEALEKVLADIEAKGISDIICLGDVVGYYTDPVACLRMVREKARILLPGNHEAGVVDGELANGFNAFAQHSTMMTRQMLEEAGELDFLKSLAHTESVQQNGCLYVHATPLDPFMVYVPDQFFTDAGEPFGEGLGRDVDQITRNYNYMSRPNIDATLAVVGHSHDPCIIDLGGRKLIRAHEVEYRFTIEKGKRYILNVGAVGQPREKIVKDGKVVGNGGTAACYVVIDGDNITWKKVSYDVSKTIDSVKQFVQNNREAMVQVYGAFCGRLKRGS